eukprot:jgi/Galph1/5139/GphlegSOOS_G3752.1
MNTSLASTFSYMKARKTVASFLREHLTSEVIFENNRIVVLESEVPISVAFTAFLENDIRGAPIWNSEEKKFVDIMTSIDLLEVLFHWMVQMDSSPCLADWKCIPLATWKKNISCPHVEPSGCFIFAEAEGTLYDACCILKKYPIHKLPVFSMDDNMVIHLLSHSRILSFVYEHIGHTNRELEELFSVPVGQVNIGTLGNVIGLDKKSTLRQVLMLLHEHRVSALPVLDENGCLLDLFARSDICHFVRNWNEWDGDTTIDTVLATFRPETTYVYTCSVTDSLRQVFDKFCKTLVHRLFIIDEQQKVVGVLSLTDLLGYFLD